MARFGNLLSPVIWALLLGPLSGGWRLMPCLTTWSSGCGRSFVVVMMRLPWLVRAFGLICPDRCAARATSPSGAVSIAFAVYAAAQGLAWAAAVVLLLLLLFNSI